MRAPTTRQDAERQRSGAQTARVAPPSGGRGAIGPVLVALALVAAVVSYAWVVPESGFPTWLRLRAEVSEAEARIRSLEQQNRALRDEVGALANESFAQERAVRETLGWARPDEIVVRSSTGSGRRVIP